MTTVYTVPSSALARARPLLATIGWRGEPMPGGWMEEPRGAVDLAATGRAVLFVPSTARVSRDLRRIAVVHGGSRGEMTGIEAADALAITTGADIVALHAPSAYPERDSAGLPFGLGDHPEHDWAEWRDEFIRRFCPCSAGVEISVRVVSGPPVLAVSREAGRIAAGLLVVSHVRRSSATEADLLAAIAAMAPCPTLIVPTRPADNVASDDSRGSRHLRAMKGSR